MQDGGDDPAAHGERKHIWFMTNDAQLKLLALLETLLLLEEGLG